MTKNRPTSPYRGLTRQGDTFPPLWQATYITWDLYRDDLERHLCGAVRVVSNMWRFSLEVKFTATDDRRHAER